MTVRCKEHSKGSIADADNVCVAVLIGGHWSLIRAPAKDNDGKNVKCDVGDLVSLRRLMLSNVLR